MTAIASRFRTSVLGLAPETIALLLAVGLVLGVFPVFGCPTVLCAMAAVVLRLNLPAIQLVNQFSSPLQLALLIPLSRCGARFFVARPATTVPVIWNLAGAARDAIAGWFCVCVPLGFVLYFVLAFALRRCECFNGLENPA